MLERISNSALAMLVITGGLLGLTFPLGQVAISAGVAPITWAFLISFGAASVLYTAMRIRRDPFGTNPRKLRYYAISGLISYALPNMLLFAAMPHLGAGFSGIMFTLSPVVTLLLSLALGLRRPNRLGIAGIAVGFAGAVTVAATRGKVGQPAELVWIAAGLMIPVALALGNIYRTIDWPKGAGPIELAVGSHAASAAMLLGTGLLVPAAGFDPAALSAAALPAIVQVASSSTMFVFFFRLQQVGGPVYLSQIGYVAAAIGLFSGTLFLDERYSLLTWAGALVIFAGVTMTTRAQRAEARR